MQQRNASRRLNRNLPLLQPWGILTRGVYLFFSFEEGWSVKQWVRAHRTLHTQFKMFFGVGFLLLWQGVYVVLAWRSFDGLDYKCA